MRDQLIAAAARLSSDVFFSMKNTKPAMFAGARELFVAF